MSEERKVLLSLNDVEVKFNVRGRVLTAIRGVTFDIYENESIAIVGESGSGKSVLTKTFTGMLESNGFISKGSVIYQDDQLSKIHKVLTKRDLHRYHKLVAFLDEAAKATNGKEVYHEMQNMKQAFKNAMRLSKKTMKIVKENIIFAISIKELVLLLSALGVSTMWEAVFADVGVSIIAVVNALRVLNVKNK